MSNTLNTAPTTEKYNFGQYVTALSSEGKIDVPSIYMCSLDKMEVVEYRAYSCLYREGNIHLSSNISITDEYTVSVKLDWVYYDKKAVFTAWQNGKSLQVVLGFDRDEVARFAIETCRERAKYQLDRADRLETTL